MTNRSDGRWIKASASSDGAECVEMRPAGPSVQVRDSKLGHRSPIHTMTRAGFATWLASAKSGELDQLSR
ncbi:DUF397 domain-containing protein [Kineosporia sp. NBRC 101731]|uniref:DUF397 domain-containing protein n=1 Tax=Kineosporia sp. NBRC 101731 TaxID=3032199 RepID=UPI0024A0863D|nr:DUF397 domain-containing protein [Kineosporia sp. NBRC 101731]GLY32532.1 hypothetical protein Kisp02_58970 [Kineosporia sp. NBRC 101731]